MDLIQPSEVLKQYFGYDSFRAQQEEIVNAVLEGKDCLVLMPTGGGKSMCFQVPAMVKPGICLVISPLIALMKDQVEGLLQAGIKAAYINSTQSMEEQMLIARQCMSGQLKLLYVSPEKLLAPNFQRFMAKLDVNLIAIDEAHCVSFWGHDFRPEYAQLSLLKRTFPKVPVIALTATADRITRDDILNQLDLKDPEIFVSSFDRPNLRLEVRPAQKRLERILDFLEERKNDAGIIYCLSRKSTEQVAEKLRAKGYNAAHYHARMPQQDRAKTQEDFLKDDIQIVCATIAFGMGIDKSNVRYVIHYNLPKNIESYYQEIGRAGRDGLPGRALLFYSFRDLALQQQMLEEEESDVKEIKLAKLDRLKQFAEAHTCRRSILLNYFSEERDEDCGNCDVCSNPRQKFDGTIIAQKALSAVARAKESAAITLTIDILRGMRNKRVLEKGYDKLKTYGAGRDLSFLQWQSYITQLINQDYLRIAYDEFNALKLGPKGKKVLFEKTKVELVRAEQILAKKAEPKKTKAETMADQLFGRLRELRKHLADEQGIPAFRIFSDKTLWEMVKERPITQDSFSNVSGVGSQKMLLYGNDFMSAILDFMTKEGKTMRGSTQLISLGYFKDGKSVSEIAATRSLGEATIIGHLISMHEKGHDIDLKSLINKERFDIVNAGFESLNWTTDDPLQPVYNKLAGKFNYGELQLVAACRRLQLV